jgi:hypothetical protein
LAKSLPDETKVYALDNNGQQGVYTIGDIKQLMKDAESNN